MSEIILYAAIATIICAMLYSVLGKPVGRGPESAIDPTKFMAKPEEETPAVIEPLEEYGNFPDLRDIREFDQSFSLKTFLDQAQGAYAIILESFADADRELLQELLSPSVYKVYEQAIIERETNNLTQVTDLARIVDAEVTEVKLNKNVVLTFSYGIKVITYNCEDSRCRVSRILMDVCLIIFFINVHLD